jgi:hypothetical protein
MTAAPSWTILVPTLGERRLLFERLMGALLPQTDRYGGRVQVVAYYNHGTPRLTEIRHRMITAARSDYVSFVDDDDLVPEYFVDEVVAALEGRPDYVGFQVQCYSDGVPTAIAHHSLAYQRWRNEGARYYRDISHINPIRRDLARLADFRRTPRGGAEDRAWVRQLRASGMVRTEVVIDRIMYHYLYSTSRTGGVGSRWQKPHTIRRPATGPLVIDHDHLSYFPGCLDG